MLAVAVVAVVVVVAVLPNAVVVVVVVVVAPPWYSVVHAASVQLDTNWAAADSSACIHCRIHIAERASPSDLGLAFRPEVDEDNLISV